MKVLIIGSGAREHALAWKLSSSRRLCGLYTAPGNAGTAELGTNLPEVAPEDGESVLQACREHRINMVFIGPEAPLAAGVADTLREGGIPVIGPGREAAQLESSKAFSKRFMQKYGIPTAEASEVSSKEQLAEKIQGEDTTYVLKKSGLAAGKGVLESSNRQELQDFGESVLQGKDTLLVEEFLQGYEVSLFILMDGSNRIILPPCSDFKKAGEGDTGPNTGGMGAICPVPWVDQPMMDWIEREIVDRTMEGLRQENLCYPGILFIGLMITEDGPRVLEYNVRLGDPEAQVLLPLIESDFGNLAESVVQGTLRDFPLSISSRSATGVVTASAGYPGKYPKHIPVDSVPPVSGTEGNFFHSSTYLDEKGVLRTNGGRCFTAVNYGSNTLRATVKAYEAAARIQFDGAWYRKDIGKKYYMEEN